jgi:hypothetical protein
VKISDLISLRFFWFPFRYLDNNRGGRVSHFKKSNTSSPKWIASLCLMEAF